jgi:hypothetical protein
VGFFHLVCFAESSLLLSAGTNRDARKAASPFKKHQNVDFRRYSTKPIQSSTGDFLVKQRRLLISEPCSDRLAFAP